MRMITKSVMIRFGAILLAGAPLFAGGCFSKPRDFSSPSATIRIVDPSENPINGLEVGRRWYDSDVGKDGRDSAGIDASGTYTFPKVPAKVGLFTGAWRKTYGNLGMCGAGSGTTTTIDVRFSGRYDVLPRDRPLHPAGNSYQDTNGVWFVSTLDSNSNTLVSLTFPSEIKSIEYVLSAKRLP